MTMPRLLPRDLTPEMPVVVVGAKEGRVLPKTGWESASPPRETFANLSEAKLVYPDLSLESILESRFVRPVVEENYGKPCSRFDTHEVHDWLMEDCS